MDDLLRQLNLIRNEFAGTLEGSQRRALEQMDAVINSAKDLMSEFSGMKMLADPNLMSAEVIKPDLARMHNGREGSKHVTINIDNYTVNSIRDLPAMPGKIVVLYYKEDK
jgi:hypothetical protein